MWVHLFFSSTYNFYSNYSFYLTIFCIFPIVLFEETLSCFVFIVNKVLLIFSLKVLRFATSLYIHITHSGRIVAGDETITDGLQQPTEMCDPQNRGFCTIKQNLTRVLQASDDKKILQCVANHISLKGKKLSAEFNIKVNCKYVSD